MNKRHQKMIPILLLLLIACGLFIMYFSNEKKDSENRLIAIVNGEKIYSDDINKITKMIDVMNLNQLSSEQLKEAVQKHKITSLLDDIKQIIIEQQIKKYRLTVSEQEVQSKINEMFANIDSDMARKTIEKSNAIYNALLEWQKDKSKSDIIYNEELAPFAVKKAEWELLQILYDTPEKLKQMQVPKNIEDMKKFSYESAKNDLLYQKLMDTVGGIHL